MIFNNWGHQGFWLGLQTEANLKPEWKQSQCPFGPVYFSKQVVFQKESSLERKRDFCIPPRFKEEIRKLDLSVPFNILRRRSLKLKWTAT